VGGSLDFGRIALVQNQNDYGVIALNKWIYGGENQQCKIVETYFSKGKTKSIARYQEFETQSANISNHSTYSFFNGNHYGCFQIHLVNSKYFLANVFITHRVYHET